MASDQEVKIRSYSGEVDRFRVEDLERRCEVGPADNVFLYTDTMGDPMCRIRNSPMSNMLVAEWNKEVVGVIRGTIKIVTVNKLPKNMGMACRVGYILGLRVSPLHRRKGIGLRLVQHLEQWFLANQVDYAYMATDKDNEASAKLFMHKLDYVKFRTPAILVHPVTPGRSFSAPPKVEIQKLKVEHAEFLYRSFMASTEFFPHDIDKILRNKLSLGTWVAYPRGDVFPDQFGGVRGKKYPSSWAMVSVWNSGELFKLRIGKAPLSCFLYTMSSKLIERALPCFKVAAALPDFYTCFGFYFMYGLYHDGPSSGKLVRTLCKFVHHLAATQSKDCKVVVTEVGGCDPLKLHIPHWKLLSCPEDLWCIKSLKNEEEVTENPGLTRAPIFVDPRDV